MTSNVQRPSSFGMQLRNWLRLALLAACLLAPAGLARAGFLSNLTSTVTRPLSLFSGDGLTRSEMPGGCCNLQFCGPPRPQDEVWLINTRHLGCDEKSPQPDFYRYECEQGWAESSAADFEATASPDVHTIVYVHGYGFDELKARQVGWALYHSVTDGYADGRPLRFVIWSWPSKGNAGPLKDMRERAWRADADAYYLGSWLARISVRTSVRLIGSSMGNRVVCGALHLLGGGSLAGWSVPPLAEQDAIRAVLISPAVHNYWLHAGEYHGNALAPVDRMLLLNNHCDALLKRYWLVADCGPASALGYTGLDVSGVAGQWQHKVEQDDACCDVGKHHGVLWYLCSPRLLERIRAELLW